MCAAPLFADGDGFPEYGTWCHPKLSAMPTNSRAVRFAARPFSSVKSTSTTSHSQYQ